MHGFSLVTYKSNHPLKYVTNVTNRYKATREKNQVLPRGSNSLSTYSTILIKVGFDEKVHKKASLGLFHF
jgi:hypothetical protein